MSTMTGEAGFVTVASIELPSIEFVWGRRIAYGRLSIIATCTGAVGSLVAADLAANISRGRDGARRPSPQNVVFLPLDRGTGQLLPRRLAAADADRARILVPPVSQAGTPPRRGKRARRSVESLDLPSVERALGHAHSRVLVVDGLADVFTLDGRVAEASRTVLETLADLAARRDAAVVVVVRLAEKIAGTPADWQLGALAGCDAAYAVFGLLPARDEPEQFCFLPAALPFGAQRAAVFGLRKPDRDAADGAGSIDWLDEELDLGEAVSLAGIGRRRRQTRFDRAIDWLVGQLSGGGKFVVELRAQAKKDFQAWGTVERVKTYLRIDPQPFVVHGTRRSFWELPSAQRRVDPAGPPEATLAPPEATLSERPLIGATAEPRLAQVAMSADAAENPAETADIRLPGRRLAQLAHSRKNQVFCAP